MGGKDFARRATCTAAAVYVAAGGFSRAIATNQSIKAAATAPVASHTKSIGPMTPRQSPFQKIGNHAKSVESGVQDALTLNQRNKNNKSLNSALSKKTTTSKSLNDFRSKAAAKPPSGKAALSGKSSNQGLSRFKGKSGGQYKSTARSSTTKNAGGAKKGASIVGGKSSSAMKCASSGKSSGASRGGTSGGSSKGR